MFVDFIITILIEIIKSCVGEGGWRRFTLFFFFTLILLYCTRTRKITLALCKFYPGPVNNLTLLRRQFFFSHTIRTESVMNRVGAKIWNLLRIHNTRLRYFYVLQIKFEDRPRWINIKIYKFNFFFFLWPTALEHVR